MKIVVNGAPRQVTARALPELLVELGYGGDRVATAVNENFVPSTARADVVLDSGDRLEIVAPRQGG